MTETIAPGPAQGGESTGGADRVADLRSARESIGFLVPVAVSASVRKQKTFAALFAGDGSRLYRGRERTVYALEDRCAHRQGSAEHGRRVEGDVLRCCLPRMGPTGAGGNGRNLADSVPCPRASPAAAGRPGLTRCARLRPVFVSPATRRSAHGSLSRAAGFDSSQHKT